jgi:peroxiredoxin
MVAGQFVSASFSQGDVVMMRQRVLTFIVAFGVVAAAAASVAQALEIGAQGPAWRGLIGVDDKEHSLSDLKKAEAVVVCFTCNHCPVAKNYEDRLVKFVKDYKGKGVALVAINVNNLEADKLPAMKDRAEEKSFNFPYLYDPTQDIARKYGATVTPHVFLLDAKRKVVYMGAIDDSQKAAKVKKHYLRDAVDAVLAGRTPAPAKTKQFGCGIKYEKKKK